MNPKKDYGDYFCYVSIVDGNKFRNSKVSEKQSNQYTPSFKSENKLATK